MSRAPDRSGQRTKRFLVPLLTGVTVLTASALGIATNIATDLLPQDWEWPKNPKFMWLAVLGLTILGALVAWLIDRKMNQGTAYSSEDAPKWPQAHQMGTIGDIRLENSTGNTFIGNINAESLKIYNAQDPEEGSEDSERSARLSDLAAESNARLVDRWMAVGLREAIAEGLASDESVGSIDRLGSSMPDAKLFAIVGEFGSGKSVTVERLYQKWIREAIEDERKPIPIFLEARFIEGTIDSEIRRVASGIGDPAKTGIRLILDGLDEPGPLRASDLLSQTRRLIRQRPNSQAVITVRPGLELGDLKTVVYPPMTQGEIEILLQRVGVNPNLQYSESASIREAMRLPLFAIIAAVLSGEGAGVPRSRGAFLEALAAKALSKNAGRDIEPLRKSILRLAFLSLSGYSRVAIGEVGDLGRVEALCATRLVTRRGMTVSFALPIFEQYFAGQAILENGIPGDILASPAQLSHWQDALALGVSMGSWSSSSRIIESIAAHYPGIAAAIVTRAVPNYDDSEETPLPSAQECGQRLRRTLMTWTSELAPLGRRLGFNRNDGSLTSIAVGVQGSHLSWGIVSPEASATLPEVVPAGPETRDLCPTLGSGIVSPHYAAWPWLWSLSQIRDAIERTLRDQSIDISNKKADQERDWALAKALLNRGSANHSPIPKSIAIEALDRLLSRLSENVQAVRFQNRRIVTVSQLSDFRRRLCDGELLALEDSLVRPYPTPDLSPYGSRWIWEGYTEETLRVLVEEVYTNALSIYEDMVAENFPKLLPTLGIGGALPLLLEGVLTFGRDAEEYGSPNLYLKTVLLGQSETSGARIRIGQESHPLERDFARVEAERALVEAQIKKFRPTSDGWLTVGESWSAVDDVFGDTPAIDQACSWLWRDLRRIGLIKSNAPIWLH